MIKNTQFTIPFSVVSTTTGELTNNVTNWSCQYSLNGTSWSATTNLPVTTGYTGIFNLTLTAEETNADVIQVHIIGGGIEPVHLAITPDEPDYATSASLDDIALDLDYVKDHMVDANTELSLSATAISEIRDGLATQATVTAVGTTVGNMSSMLTTLNSTVAKDATVQALPTAAAIAQACATQDLSSIAVAPVYSQYTATMAALNSKVVIEESANTGSWQIKKPDGTLQTTRAITTNSDAAPIVEIGPA